MDEPAKRERYKHLHVTLPPAIADLVDRISETTYRSKGQVVVDALLAHYGYGKANDGS